MNNFNKLIFAILFSSVLAIGSFMPIAVSADEDETAAGDETAKTKSDRAESAPPEENLSDSGLPSSIDADVTFAFTRPVIQKPYEFQIGKEVHFLVGFKNKGQQVFQVNNIGASFRYAQDFSYALQNFSSLQYNKLVEPNEETTFGYTFLINEAYIPRTYGFVVNLNYASKDGVQYENTVFNQTIALIEVDDGLDGESIFLYVILIAFAVLIAYGLNSLFIKYFGVSKRQVAKPVEQEKIIHKREVDYDWIPNTVTSNMRKTSAGNKKMAPAN